MKSRVQAQDTRLRFLNVAGGTHAECVPIATDLRRAGFAVNTAEGPLHRSQVVQPDGQRAYSHMPLSSSKVGKLLKRFFTAGVEMSKANGTADLDEQSGLSSHSGRRSAAKIARMLADVSEADPDLVDAHFRWATSAAARASMKARYAGNWERSERLRITQEF